MAFNAGQYSTPQELKNAIEQFNWENFGECPTADAIPYSYRRIDQPYDVELSDNTKAISSEMSQYGSNLLPSLIGCGAATCLATRVFKIGKKFWDTNCKKHNNDVIDVKQDSIEEIKETNLPQMTTTDTTEFQSREKKSGMGRRYHLSENKAWRGVPVCSD